MLWPCAEYSALGRDFTPSEALSPSASGIAKLEKQDGRKEGEAHAVSQDDDGIALHDAVDDPKRDAGREDEEHFQRDVMGLARLPDLLDLRNVRDRRAERRDKADQSDSHGAATAPMADRFRSFGGLESVFRPVLQPRPDRPLEQEPERRVARGPKQRDRDADAAGGHEQRHRAEGWDQPGLE